MSILEATTCPSWQGENQQWQHRKAETVKGIAVFKAEKSANK